MRSGPPFFVMERRTGGTKQFRSGSVEPAVCYRLYSTGCILTFLFQPDPPPVNIDADTRLVTLIGHPVEHTLSPRIHNAAFRAQGVNALYVATPVRPNAIEDAIGGLRALQFLGANVTIPHKQAVLPLLDTVTERARAVGAVNTITGRTEDDDDGAVSGGSALLRGDNTDVEGFLEPLEEHAEIDNLEGAPMLVFGAGGAARAVAYGLLHRYAPNRLTLVARRSEQADALARDLSEYDREDAFRVASFDDAGSAVRSSRLLVNATPLGMHPEPEATPWTTPGDFGSDHIAYDLIYNPAKTRFLRDADRRAAFENRSGPASPSRRKRCARN